MNAFLTSGPSVKVAFATAISVLSWCLLTVGVAFPISRSHSDAAMALLFIFGVPLLPGAAMALPFGAHSGAVPVVAVTGNVIFYLAAVFIIRRWKARPVRG